MNDSNLQFVKRVTIIVWLTCIAFTLKAQSELTLPFFRDVFQATYLNPALESEHTVSIGIPVSTFIGLTQNGFIPDHFITREGNTFTISPDKLYENLNDKNMIQFEENTDLFHLRLKIAGNFFWIGIRQHASVTSYLPKDLFAIPVKGNAPYIGSEMDFSNLKADASLYNEYTLGISRVMDKWTIGGRLSVLQGLSNLSFDPDVFSLAIDSTEYAAHVDGKIRTSGIPKNGEGEISFDHLGNMDWMKGYLTNFSNLGLALSGGVTYKMNEQIRFSFSFNNLGFINWEDSIETYTVTGSSVYDGLTVISDYLYDRETDVDSVLNKMKDDFIQDTIAASYSTWLHPTVSLSGHYQIANRTEVGLSLSGIINKKFYPAVTLAVQQGIGREFNIIGSVSYYQRTIRNVGVGIMVKPGPLQFLVVADNIFPAINPMYTTHVNLRIGINMVFGRVKTADKLSYR